MYTIYERLVFRSLTLTQKEKTMPDKSGYQIRAELLDLARGILSERMHMELQVISDKSSIKLFTTEDVIREADKLYEFVQRK